MNTSKASLTKKAAATSANSQRGASMKSFVIEKDIEVPTPARSTGRPSAYPFESMVPGDSFFVAAHSPSEYARVRNAANAYGRRNGKMFATRKVDGGVRIWCVEPEAV